MKISEKTWGEYITRLFRLNETAGKKMAEYIEKHGTDDVQALTAYAQALVQKYGEGSAELACQMYDAIAEASGVSLPPAEPAAPASCRETAGMVRATQQSPLRLQDGVSRLVKRVAADTTLKNALRDEAEWAWVPHGDTCPFCITLASRGWEPASAKALKGNHAQHIHAHCNCEYAIRFDSSTTIAGYDPDKYLEEYEKANGDINAMRREHYAKHKDLINAQKRAAYQLRHPHKDAAKPPHKENLDKMSLPQLRKLAKETATEYYRSGLSGISFGEHEVEKAADLLANQGSRTSLKKDIRSMQKKLKMNRTEKAESAIIKTQTKIPNIQIGRSIGAKAKNYDIVEPRTGEIFHFAEGSKIQDAQAFAGFGTNTSLHVGVAEGLASQIGGDPKKWKHCKGHGVIDYYGEERPAEVHWFQEETVGKHKFKIKRWEDES